MGAAARSTFMRLVPALALGIVVVLAACAETSAGAVRARGPRSSADDSELWNLIPGDSDAVADVDLAALRASPWSRSLMEGSLDGEREERRRVSATTCSRRRSACWSPAPRRRAGRTR